MNTMTIKNILIYGAIGCTVWMGCDSSNVADEDGSLDEDLIVMLTKNGERTVANFILPASDDFGSIPQDPANPLTEDKVELGKLLFHETALSTNPRHESARGTYSCATCHHADAGFQAGRQQGIGDGGSGWGQHGENRGINPDYAVDEVDVQPLKSPTILNSAFQRINMWDGRFGARGMNEGTESEWLPGSEAEANWLGYEGLETQAIQALKVHRMDNIENSIVASHPVYQELWQRVFPGEPVTTEYAGLAIAAYERTVFSSQAPFQRWLKGDYGALSAAEKRGALVFFGDVGCERMCHSGGALSSMNFYALGMPDMQGSDVIGPIPPSLGRGGFLRNPDEYYRFKMQQLYNLADSPFYGHGGTFRSLREVVEYYNEGIPAESIPEHILAENFKPLHLTEQEIADLTLFLENALYDPNLDRYVPDALPSGNCFPANDAAARRDLGCE